jgi:capsular exopolysaccharide synthesis family protein
MNFNHDMDLSGALAEHPSSGVVGDHGGMRWGRFKQEQSEKPAGIRALLGIAWRQRWLMLATVVGLTAMSGILVIQIAPRYTATALVMFDAPQAHVVTTEAVKEEISASVEALKSQIEIINSRDLASTVVERMNLVAKSEFNAQRHGFHLKTLIADIGKRIAGLLNTEEVGAVLGTPISGLLASAPAGPVDHAATAEVAPHEVETAEARTRRETVDQFLDQLTVKQEGQSQVISIAFTSIDPETAQAVANGTAEAYLERRIDEKTKIAGRALDWLETRLADLRKQTAQSEHAVGELRAQLGIAGKTDVSLITQQISDLYSQLQLARAAHREASARLRQAKALVASHGGAASASEVMSSPLIQRLREQEADVTRQVQEMASQLGPKHPRMEAADAELADIRERIREEVDRIVTSLGNEVDVAVERERSLEKSIADLHARAGEFNSTQIELTLADREATANRSLYESFLARAREVSSQLDFQQADAQIVSYADLPVDPSFPRINLVLVVAFLGASFVGIFLAVARDRFTHVGFRTLRETEQFLGIPGLALVPIVGGLRRSAKAAPIRQMMERPASAFAESIRQISLKLSLSGIDSNAEHAKVVLVTSALAREGKTSTAVCLARQRAALGNNVVLVDADLWRPKVHEVCGLERKPGLLDCLGHGTGINELVKADRASPIHIITAGEPALLYAGELLASKRMQEIVHELAERYDCVIVDTPPILAIAATRALARLADQTILVTRWQHTRREIAAAATRELLDARANLVGVILSMVHPKKSASYSYSDAAYRDRAMRSYYFE